MEPRDELEMEIEMRQLETLINGLAHQLNYLNEVMERSKRFKSYAEAELQKNIEDGIIENIGKANPYQLQKILDKDRRFFRYYTEIYDLIENGVEFEKVSN